MFYIPGPRCGQKIHLPFKSFEEQMLTTFDEHTRPQIYFHIFSVLLVWQNVAEFYCSEGCSASEILWFNAHAQKVPVRYVSGHQQSLKQWEEILSQSISYWHALLVLLSVLKMVLRKQTCKLGHGAKGTESRISDSWERLYFFLLCQGKVIAHACWNSVNMRFLPICNSHFK